jgi:hypothetical protein
MLSNFYHRLIEVDLHPPLIWIRITRAQLHYEKENKIFLVYKEIQKGAVAKSYMKKGFLIYEEMRKFLVKCEEVNSYI